MSHQGEHLQAERAPEMSSKRRGISVRLHVELDPNWLTLEVGKDGFSLAQVLRAITLYERKPPTRRSPKTLRNLVCSYNGQQDISDDEAVKILELTRATDSGLGEAAFLLVRQLCVREHNAFKFLHHDCMQHTISTLADTKQQFYHEVAAQVIGKIACHSNLGDLWMEYMMTTGLSVLKIRISNENPQNIRYACAQAFGPLATHRNLAILIIDQATDILNQIKDINSDFKEVYAEIMTVLAQHTDYTKASILDINSLPEALGMLRQGPCASQKQALVLMATLVESDCGLKALLEEEAFHHVMSAVVDSECRQVRCTALAVLYNALANPRRSFQKQVLISVDQFFHEHEEGFGLRLNVPNGMMEKPKYRMDTESRITRAVEDICDVIIRAIHKEARLKKDKDGRIVEVHLAPGIDVDPTLLTTLTHLTHIIIRLGQLKVNTLQVGDFDTSGLHEEEYSRVLRRSLGGINHSIIRTLVNRGGTCLADVLHTYSLKLIVAENVTSRTYGHDINTPTKDGIQQTPKRAWSAASERDSRTNHNAAIFRDSESKLIRTMLLALRMFAMASSDNDLCDLQLDAEKKIAAYETRRRVPPSRQLSKEKVDFDGTSDDDSVFICRRDSGVFWEEDDDSNKQEKINIHKSCSCGRMGHEHRPESHLGDTLIDRVEIQASSLDLPLDGCRHETDVLTEAGLLFKDSLEKDLGRERRMIRMKLYEAGVIESVGPWLVSQDPVIKGLAMSTLRSLIQYIPEFIDPQPIPHPSTEKHNRPMSAMTSKERDRAINVALFSMSATVGSAIKNALGIKASPPPSPRRPAAQPPPPSIFTIEEAARSISKNTAKEDTIANKSKEKDLLPASEDNNRALAQLGNTNVISNGAAGSLDVHKEPLAGTDRSSTELLPLSCRPVAKIPGPTLASPDCVKQFVGDKLKPYTHDNYESFARKSSRPQSAKPPVTRPTSAKVAATRSNRPQSAHVVVRNRTQGGDPAAPKRPVSAVGHAVDRTTSRCEIRLASKARVVLTPNGSTQSITPSPPQTANPRAEKQLAKLCPSAVCQQKNEPKNGLRRSSSETTITRGEQQRDSDKSNRKVTAPGNNRVGNHMKLEVKTKIRPISGRAPLSVVGSRPVSAQSAPASGRSVYSRDDVKTSKTNNKKHKALEEVTWKMRLGQVPWKPTLDKCLSIRGQCCHRVVEVCARMLVKDMFSRDVTVRRAAIAFIQEIIRQSEVPVHMKLSEFSLVPRLVDFLRVNEENVLEEVLGLAVARLLVQSDQRLKQLFSRCGGTELLMGMASYCRGFLRNEVASTLKTITRVSSLSTAPEHGGRRRTMSAPVGRRLPGEPPDVWDKIMERWKEEDKVAAILHRALP